MSGIQRKAINDAAINFLNGNLKKTEFKVELAKAEAIDQDAKKRALTNIQSACRGYYSQTSY
jgi:hypothetical protein